MLTVAIKNEYAEILATFGELQNSIELALQRFLIEQITTKIIELNQRKVMYQDKYGTDYLIFSQRIIEDENFIQQIEADISKTWEIDLADWEFCHRGIQDWTQKLQSILPI